MKNNTNKTKYNNSDSKINFLSVLRMRVHCTISALRCRLGPRYKRKRELKELYNFQICFYQKYLCYILILLRYLHYLVNDRFILNRT